MPDLTTMQGALRRRIGRFLRDRSPWRAPLYLALEGIGRPVPACLFGGAARDLAILGPDARPHDIDLVLGDVARAELEAAFRPFVAGHTRFGGLKLLVAGTAVDAWPLRETWAFRAGIAGPPAFAGLPRTTFTNLEAVAVELGPNWAEAGPIHASGFFEGIVARTVEVNLMPNPTPAAAVARAVALATRLGFAMGPRLSSLAARGA